MYRLLKIFLKVYERGGRCNSYGIQARSKIYPKQLRQKQQKKEERKKKEEREKKKRKKI